MAKFHRSDAYNCDFFITAVDHFQKTESDNNLNKKSLTADLQIYMLIICEFAVIFFYCRSSYLKISSSTETGNSELAK
jgi:hypothetical protein